MSLSLFCSTVVIFWIYIYYKRSKSPRIGCSPVLPLTTNSRDVEGFKGSLWKAKIGDSTVNIEVAGFLLLRCSTNLFLSKGKRAQGSVASNAFTGRATDRSSRHAGQPHSKFLTAFYNFGSLIASVGQVFTLVVLWWSTFLLLRRYYRFFFASGSASTAPTFVKRELTAFPPHLVDDIRIPIPPLLIPGVNIPLSHIYPIITALLICTGIHEYGHAIAASLEDIPLTRWGYNLFVLIPAAFVELVPPKDQNPISRIRIASSGVFHNFITIIILLLLSSFHLRQHLLPYIGYNTLENGVKVIGFAEDSSLSQYISPGAIITQLDDIPIRSYFGITVLDSWSDILLDRQKVNELTGWCLQSTLLHARFGNCCYFQSTLASRNGTCFISSDETENGCIDPFGMMEDSSWPRCDSDVDCANNNDICIRPHPSTSLVRIIFKYPNEERFHTVVWNGPKQEIWEQITVDNFEPRFSFLPSSLPFWSELLMEYINTVSLSLFFLNLLPIRTLDGGEIFLALLDFISPKSRSAEIFDLESSGLSRTTHVQGYHANSILVFLERMTIIFASSLAISNFLPL